MKPEPIGKGPQEANNEKQKIHTGTIKAHKSEVLKLGNLDQIQDQVKEQGIRKPAMHESNNKIVPDLYGLEINFWNSGLAN